MIVFQIPFFYQAKTLWLSIFVYHLKVFQLCDLAREVAVGHFSMGGQKNLKTKNLIFSVKIAEMHGRYSLGKIKNFMANN